MKTTRRILTVTVLFGALAVAHGQSYVATINSSQEAPDYGSLGSGGADFTLSGTTLSITSGFYVDVQVVGPPEEGVLLNLGAPGVNGTIIAGFTVNTPGQTSGTFSGSIPLDSYQINELNAGDLYISVGTVYNSEDQIRGQIEMVPEPSALSLLATGSLALLAVSRRKI